MSQVVAARISRRPRAHRFHWSRRGRRRAAWLGALGLALAALVSLAVTLVQRPAHELRAALVAQVESGAAPAEVARFYEIRDYQPLWVQASGARLSLRPEARRAALLAASSGDASGARALEAIAKADALKPAELARAELATSVALGDYVRGLVPAGREPLAFIDPALARPGDTGAVLDQAAAAPSLGRYLSAVAEVNPVYRDLLTGLDIYRRTWSRLPQIQVPTGPALRLGDQGKRVDALRVRLGVNGGPGAAYDDRLTQAVRRFQQAHALSETGAADAATLQALNAGAGHYEQLIQNNLRRARAFPPVFARRFVLVNVAARQLWVYEDGQPKHAMRVVVGTTSEPTPVMAGLLRYVVFNPYWNVPVDMVRTGIAPRVLKQGPGYLKAAHLQVLSDWDETPEELDPRQVDWEGVAHGWPELRVRQLPGGDNMMGGMKFMLPNPLGIYLHDTPNKAAFQHGDRLLSAGCVRLEAAGSLAQWLFGRALPPTASLAADQQADLSEPTPVYVAYLTAAPGPSGVTFFPDVYGKDAAPPPPATAE